MHFYFLYPVTIFVIQAKCIIMGPGCLLWLFTFTSELWEASGFKENTDQFYGSQTNTKEFLSQSKVSANGEETHVLNGLPGRMSSEIRVLKANLKTAEKLSEPASLVGLLAAVVQQDLSTCRLVLVYDNSDLHYAVVKDLMLRLPNARQVFKILPAMP